MIESISSQDYIDACGPWIPVEEVADHLGTDVEVIESLRDSNTFVGLRFPDGKDYYPAGQFDTDSFFIHPGAGNALSVLATRMNQTSIISAMSEKVNGGQDTQWDVLRSLPIREKAVWAQQKLDSYNY